MSGTYQAHEIRKLVDLVAVLAKQGRPVLLVEGIRALPDADRAAVVGTGQLLAERWFAKH